MKLIDLLNLLSKEEKKPILYFRISAGGRNFIIKYLYYAFIIEKIDTSYNEDNVYKEGDCLSATMILANLNKKIEIIKEN